MIESDKNRFAQIMAGMADNFRDTITKEGMRMRFDLLKQYSIEQVEQASRKILATRKFTKMPPIAEFVEALQGQEPSIEDHALVIANSIIEHMRVNGSRVFPTLDPVAKRLMMTRWPYYQWAASVLTSELQWWVKQFCEAYRAESTVGRQAIEGPAQLKQIAGSVLKSV
jgi:hypothetical protein